MKVPLNRHRMDLQRLDALALERLSSSKHVIDVYGYCGFSTMNKMASGSFEDFIRKGKLSDIGKLYYARGAATAVADAHSIDGDGKNVTLIHRDVRPSNFLMKDDNVVIHDFNLARFPMWNVNTSSPCGFLKPECTEYRSPEECMGRPLTEKLDIYSLGNIFYFILTKKRPYTYPRTLREKVYEKLIVNGVSPVLPPKIEENSDPAIVAIIKAMKDCYAYDPSDRPSAREISDELSRVLDVLLRDVRTK